MKPLRILILEDHEPDAELEVMQLTRAGYTCQWDRVQERDEFLARLHAPHYDVIFSDHNLPGFDGFAALELYRSAGLDVPLIVISGTIGEETAIESLKAGATDYVMKDRLERLPFVVERALRERDEHRQRQLAESALRESDTRFREEAEVSRALAHVGGELISLPGTRGLLETLCRLMTEVLRCDCSYTLLWQPEACVYVPEAGYGDSPEQWEALRVLRVPRDAFAGLLGVLAEHDIAQVDATSAPTPWAALPLRWGVTRVLYVPLRSHGDIIGIQVAGVRGPHAAFTPMQERIARGAAHLASLALQTARLVEDLERANRLKSDFVATISHELRTPLNVIMGYNEVLRDGSFGPLTAEQVDTLKRMDHSARQLLELVTATLDMSRLETGRLPIEVTDFDVADLIHEVRAETRELQERSGLAFVWTVPSGAGRLRSDRVKLKVIVKNLLNNAVKFTPKGSVTITVQPHEAGVEITVADTGIGIAPETVPIIFDLFRQADGSSTRRYSGVGLGLYIVRRLVELLGGTVSVTSTVGRGSTFGLRVPRSVSLGIASNATR